MPKIRARSRGPVRDAGGCSARDGGTTTSRTGRYGGRRQSEMSELSNHAVFTQSYPQGGHLDVLGAIPPEYRDAVLDQCRKQCLGRGETVWHQGDAAHHVAFLVEGKAMSTYHSPSGKAGVTGFWLSGDLLGAGDLGGAGVRLMTVRCLDDSVIYTLETDRFYAILRRFPEFAQQIVRALSIRLRWVAHLALILETHSTLGRVCGVLLALAERFGQAHEDSVIISLSLTHDDLAAMVGVSRQFMNSTLRELRQKGFIRLGRRRIIILDPERLERLACRG